MPIAPSEFKFTVPSSKRKQFNVVKGLLKKSSEIVVATDPDREGENIARSIINMAGVSSKPIKRLWINSLEKEAIQKGLLDLKEGKNYYSLYKEAETRQKSDWLVGMNASRLYSILLQQKGLRNMGAFSVGRVQTPTLALIYQRQKENEKFVSKPFQEVFGDVNVNGSEFEAMYKERFSSQEELEKHLQSHNVNVGKNSGVISKLDTKLKKVQSPKLHSLSTLQTKANKSWKYSPSDVLSIVQDLYEKKLVSYPRTSSQYITENELEYLSGNIEAYKEFLNVDVDVSNHDVSNRYVDGSKVQEHYAIVPTRQIASKEKLSAKELNIYQEVLSTTLGMFAPNYEYEETLVDVSVNDLTLSAKGKIDKSLGWKKLFKGGSKDKKEGVLPNMSEGDECIVKLKIKDGMTTPPKLYTEGQLINLMKNAGKDLDEESKGILRDSEGIGTEATRGAVIETLKNQKYIGVKKNTIHVTKKGQILCEAVEGTLLSSPEMTAKWEGFLSDIGAGKRTQESFISNVYKFIDSLMKDAPEKVNAIEGLVNESKESLSVGVCPECEKGQIEDRGKFYGCSGYSEGCKFSLPKRWAGKTLSETQIKTLLDKGETNLIKGFKSKKGSKFDAYLMLKNGKLNMKFDN